MSNWNSNPNDPHNDNNTLGYEPRPVRNAPPTWVMWAPLFALGAIVIAAASFFSAQALGGSPEAPAVLGASIVGEPTPEATPGEGEPTTEATVETSATPEPTEVAPTQAPITQPTQAPVSTPTQAPAPTATPTPEPTPDDAPSVSASARASTLHVDFSLDAEDDHGITSITVKWGDGTTSDVEIDGDNRTFVEDTLFKRYASGGEKSISVTVTDNAGQATTETYPVFVKHYVGVDLSNIDADAYVYVNGKEVYYTDDASGYTDISSHLVRGANTVEIWLGNYDCFSASLSGSLTVNNTRVSERHYESGGWTHCGWVVEWQYRIDGNTGAATQLK